MIKFNNTQAIIDLHKNLTVALLQLREELITEAKQGMSSEGAADLNDGEIKNIAGLITVYIVGGPWAIISEFGTGSLMDESNPFLDEYRNSPAWNPARHDNKIRGRPAGSQQTMFGTREFTGAAPGVDLEKLAKAGVIDSKYLPQPPSKALRTAAAWMSVGRFQKVIAGVLATFPWGNYLTITPVR